MRLRATTVIVGAVALLATACGTSSGSAAANPTTLLTQAKSTIDRSPAFHFSLTAAGKAGGSGITIDGGSGDLQRPDKLVGSFSVTFDGIPATVKVAAGGGKFYAQLPTSPKFVATNPAAFGIANPAQLISPTDGLSSILSDTQQAKSAGRTRLDGELVDVVTGSVPGTDITVIPDKVPSRAVSLKAYINPSNHQLRQVILTGPIESTTSSSFTVGLSNYGEHVDLAIPTS